MSENNPANLIIIQLLHTNKDATDTLRVCWDQLFPQQKKQIFHYLFLAQQHATFYQMLRQELLHDDPVVPWSEFFALLEKSKKLSSGVVELLLHHEAFKPEDLTFRAPSPALHEIWAQKKKQFFENSESKKQSLMKDLEFAKNQGLKDKRLEALNQLKKYFPNDRGVESAFQSEKEFRARHLYNKLVTKKENQTSHKKDLPLMTADEEKQLIKTVKKYLKLNADYAYDFSVMFMEMDCPRLGLQVIDLLKKKSQKMLWYELTLSIQGEQFARALSTIAVLQKKRVSSDQSFSLMYYQALALYGLGNTSQAIRIVKNIVKIRPQFKSAHSLLLEWGVDP